MPSLTVETSGVRRGGVITSRVLVGRLPTNGIVLADTSVSRLHAWIDCDLEGLYYVADTGSLTGTWVNNKPVDRRQALHDRDVIRVGKAQLVFHETNDLEPDVQPVNLAGYPPFEDVDQAGVLFECVCGAPAWFKATAIGHTHKCRQCGRSVVIPDKPGVRAHPIGEPVGAPEAVATHGLAESYAGEANSGGRHAYDEHGLSESYGGQTAVADAEPQVQVQEEHGLAEIQPSPDAGGANDPSAYVSESTVAAEVESRADDDNPFEPEIESPTLEQMLAAEDEIATPGASADAAAGRALSDSPSAEPNRPPAPIDFEHFTTLPSEEVTAPATDEPLEVYSGAVPAEVVAETEVEPGAPRVDSYEPVAEPSAPAGRPSLFASRQRPAAVPQPTVADDRYSPMAPAADVAAFNAPAEPSPLDAFDGYARDEASVVTQDTPPFGSVAQPAVGVTEVPFTAPDEEATGTQTCSVCHTGIAADEATTTCPSCGLTFHTECWHENQGCSAYGCPQVGALAPKEQPQPAEANVSEAAGPYDAAEPEEPFPWEFLYLAASIVGTLLGLLVFGVPSLIAAVGTLIYKVRFPDPARRNGVVTLSILLALLGVGLGIVASVYWWFGGFAGLNLGRLRGK